MRLKEIEMKQIVMLTKLEEEIIESAVMMHLIWMKGEHDRNGGMAHKMVPVEALYEKLKNARRVQVFSRQVKEVAVLLNNSIPVEFWASERFLRLMTAAVGDKLDYIVVADAIGGMFCEPGQFGFTTDEGADLMSEYADEGNWIYDRLQGIQTELNEIKDGETAETFYQSPHVKDLYNEQAMLSADLAAYDEEHAEPAVCTDEES